MEVWISSCTFALEFGKVRTVHTNNSEFQVLSLRVESVILAVYCGRISKKVSNSGTNNT